MTTVNFGTPAVATAVTSLAPSRAMPPASYFLPPMKPVMFCSNTRGMLRCPQKDTRLLSAGARDAARLVFLAGHEAGDVLQEHKGNVALAAQFDEMGAL